MNPENYSKRTHREHILELPDTYIGSIDTEPQSRWIYDPAIKRMVWKKIQFCPGFFKIFDEILVNARDASVNDSSCDTIKVEYNKKKVTSVFLTMVIKVFLLKNILNIKC